MTTTPVTWSTPTRVNVFEPELQSFGRVVGLENGNSLVVWVDRNDTEAPDLGSDIVGRLYDPVGRPVGGAFQLNETITFRDEQDPEVAALPGGGFVVVYEAAAFGNDDIMWETYDARGNRLDGGYVVNDDPTLSAVYSDPSVAAATDGSFFVTYESGVGSVEQIRGTKIAANGTTTLDTVLRDDFTVVDPNDYDPADPETVRLSNGNFATVMTVNSSDGDGGTEQTLAVRISSVNGANGGFIGTVTTAGDFDDRDPRIAALPDGFVVVWEDGADIFARVFANNGIPTAGPARVGGVSDDAQFDPDVIGLEDGSFVVTWSDLTDERIEARRFGESALPIGLQYVVDDTSGSIEFVIGPNLGLTSDGRILTSYVFRNTGGSNDIALAIDDPREGPVFAEAGDGATTATPGGALVVGTPAADRIFGADGNDTLRGDFSNDVLEGRGGDDVIIGGQGRDTIAGGSGSDTVEYDRDGGGISINLQSGRGRRDAAGDRFSSVENVTGTDARDVVFGDDADNTISGLGQRDIIRAFAGDDVLFGGDGDDKLDGGAGADEINGGAGLDTVVYDRSDAGVTINLGNGRGIGGWADGDDLQGISHVLGSVHDDVILGRDGLNILQGLGGDDLIAGGDGNDYIYGQAGDDRLGGGDGDDRLKGGPGADVYAFDSSDGFDYVRSFQRSIDRLDLPSSVSFDDLVIERKSWGTRIDFADTTIALINVTGAITEDQFLF